jgi:hypothetical protein
MGRKKKEILIEEPPKSKFQDIKVGDLFLCEFKTYKYVIEVEWEKRGHFWLNIQYLKSKISKSKKQEEQYGFLATIESAHKTVEEKSYEKISRNLYKKYLTEGI